MFRTTGRQLTYQKS